MIEKRFVDPETDKPRKYQAEVRRYEYVPEKQKWLYYVEYLSDGTGEYMAEYSIGKCGGKVTPTHTPEQLFVKYFGGAFEYYGGARDWLRPIDWKQFLDDLNLQPELADLSDSMTHNAGGNDGYPLQYALLYIDVPLRVVDRLIQFNPGALELVDDHDTGRNILHWTIGDNGEGADLDPNIITKLLVRRPEMAVELYNRSADCSRPIAMCIRFSGPTSKQVKAMLRSSPHAVAWVISQIYAGLEKATPELLDLALELAYEHELELCDEEGGFLNRV